MLAETCTVADPYPVTGRDWPLVGVSLSENQGMIILTMPRFPVYLSHSCIAARRRGGKHSVVMALSGIDSSPR